MQQLQTTQTQSLMSIDPDLYLTMKNSLYPGAKDESISLVISYCKAAKLDPMLKPVHIVPMSVKDSKSGKYEWRDIIMPGVNLYRILASRSGCAGISEPEFGEDVSIVLDKKSITYPKWCKVTVRKIINGETFEFSAKEFWLENYATAGKDTNAPNAMWSKRPYGQLAKCAQAQALRTAFPEICSLPTAEEMEGKNIDNDIQVSSISLPKEKGIEGLKHKIIKKESEAIVKEWNDISEMVEEKEYEEAIESETIQNSDGTVSMDEVKKAIGAANNISDLIKALDMSRALTETEQSEIKGMYKWKEKKLAEAA